MSTRRASDTDLPFLGTVDGHVSYQDLTHLLHLGRVMVAEVDGVAAGCLRWGLFWDQVPFINLLWVVVEWRGQGVGTTLVVAWEQTMLAGGHHLILTSTSSAERAQHFYRRLGYIDNGSLLLPREPTELILRKSLGE